MSELENIYNELFTPEYLIRFGYFSYRKNKDTNSNNDEYFNTETFYKMFNLDDFSIHSIEILEQIMATRLQGRPDFIDKTWTEPIYFNIPKKGLVRRQYKLPNLYSYTILVKFMCENKDNFINIFLNNKLSISKYFDSPKYKYETIERIKSRLLQSGNKQLHLDLSNFYHTLYTHSIPWMIMGKENAKSNRGKGFANNLDSLIQACQYGETHGIPTGNVPSRIIAELFMCYFDKDLVSKGFKYARYVDDFTFVYSLENEKEEFMEQVNLLCREYNLYLNTEKTEIEDFPQNNQRSKSVIFNFFDSHNFTNIDLKKQRNLIYDYIDLCITEESIGNKGALKIIFSGLLRNIIYKGNFTEKEIDDLFLFEEPRTLYSLLEKILDVSIKSPGLTNKFMDLFENLFTNSKLRTKAKKVVQKYFKENQESLKKKILYSKKNNFSQEFYQILLYITQFDIDTSSVFRKKDILSLIDNRVDDFSLCLLVVIYIKRKLSLKDLLHKINELLAESNRLFKNRSRFSGKFWFFRYFIYYLIQNDIIKHSEVRKFHKNNNFPISKKRGYKSELNSKYIFRQGNQQNINKFYEELLSRNISLVDCGEKQNFKYFL